MASAFFRTLRASSSAPSSAAVLVALTCAVLTFSAAPAYADSVVAGNCPVIGDLSAQIAGWRDRGKTQEQAFAQIDKYYADKADRDVLKHVTELIYLDPRKRLVPEQVTVQMTSQCLEQQAHQTPRPAPAKP